MKQFIEGNIPSAACLVGIWSEHSVTMPVTKSSSPVKREHFFTFFLTARVIFLLKALSADSFWLYFSWTSWYILQDLTKDSQYWFPQSPKSARSHCSGWFKKFLSLSEGILKLWRSIYYKTFSELTDFAFICKLVILISLTCFIASLKFSEGSLHPLAAAAEILYKY